MSQGPGSKVPLAWLDCDFLFHPMCVSPSIWGCGAWIGCGQGWGSRRTRLPCLPQPGHQQPQQRREVGMRSSVVDALPSWGSGEEREGRGTGCPGPQMPSTGRGSGNDCNFLVAAPWRKATSEKKTKPPGLSPLRNWVAGGRRALSLLPWQPPGVANSVGSLFGKNSGNETPITTPCSPGAQGFVSGGQTEAEPRQLQLWEDLGLACPRARGQGCQGPH